MMDRPLAAFDIETVPDTEIGRRLDGFAGDFYAVADKMQQKRLEDTDGASDFLQVPYHRIVTISVAWLDIKKSRTAEGRSQQVFKLGTLGDDDVDEGNLLQAFFHVLERQKPRLISWNGNGFDLPVIRYRALLHGIDAGAYYNDNQDRYNNYVNRYHDLHTDLMDVLAGFGASRSIGLDALCQIVGLPGKTVTEGHRVFQHIGRGEWDLVKTYCELDALNTLMLYLAFDRSRGRLGPEEFDEARETIANALAGDPREPVKSYGEAIRTWQLGRTRRQLEEELKKP